MRFGKQVVSSTKASWTAAKVFSTISAQFRKTCGKRPFLCPGQFSTVWKMPAVLPGGVSTKLCGDLSTWGKTVCDSLPERKQKQAKHPGGRFACLFGIGHAVFYCRLNQLDDRHFSGITAAGADLHNLGITALTVSILRCNFVKELLSDALLGYICHNLAL